MSKEFYILGIIGFMVSIFWCFGVVLFDYLSFYLLIIVFDFFWGNYSFISFCLCDLSEIDLSRFNENNLFF